MESTFGPIQTISASDVVRQRLLDWIAAHSVNGEERLLSERVLAEQLQVSRTTLREALRSLSLSGVVVPRQGSGWYVRENLAPLIEGLAVHLRFREMSLEQLIEARQIIEPPIAALAAQRRTAADLLALEGAHEGMDEANEDLQRFEVLDQQFHRSLGVASQNPFFSIAIQPMLTLLREKRISVLHARGAPQASNREHGAILRAVQRQDATTARDAMTAHLTGFIRRMNAAPVKTARARQTAK